jgi:nicotinamide mononucleotide transporter
MSTIEIIGFITALLGVWLTIRQNILCWLVNIISSLFYCIYFFELKLYADSSLQVFFVVMGVYGWVNWRKPDTGLRLPVTGIRIKQFLILSVLILVISYLIS